jgi:hypothetical protein
MQVNGYQFTNASKAHVVESLAIAFERRELLILDDPVLVGELEAYESERLPAGMIRYNAPEGMHDDCVIALGLAWFAAQVGQVEYAPDLWV